MNPVVLSPELLIAMAGFVTAIVSIATQWRAGIMKARVDEVELLHAEISRLQERCEKAETNLDRERRNRMRLQDYIASLRAILIASKIEIPEIPKLD